MFLVLQEILKVLVLDRVLLILAKVVIVLEESTNQSHMVVLTSSLSEVGMVPKLRQLHGY